MTNERFSYKGSDFLRENLKLQENPKTSVDANNKLSCLAENNYRRNPNYKPFEYAVVKRSKRYNRILKMFWVYYRQENRQNLQYILCAEE